MAAVGARPVLYHHAGDDALSPMSSYFSHGGSSTSSSASSFSAALAPAPQPMGADPAAAAQFDISEYLFDDVAQGVFGAAPPAADAPPPHHVVQADSGAAAVAGAGASAAAHAAR